MGKFLERIYHPNPRRMGEQKLFVYIPGLYLVVSDS